MQIFEFVVSLYVVIAGLGVTLLVRSIGQMIESRDRITFYWVHTSWLGFAFLLHVNSWFTLWNYRLISRWTVGQFLLLVSVPTLLYLASHISVPEISEDSTQRYDMRAYYYERHRILLSLLSVSVLFTLFSEYLLVERELLTVGNGMRLAGLGLLAAGIASERHRVQAAVVFGVIAIVVWALGFVGHPIE